MELVERPKTMTKRKKGLELDQVLQHDGKLYLAEEIVSSRTIKPEDRFQPKLAVEALITLLQWRLDHCLDRLLWAMANDRIVTIEGADQSHIYYESTETKVAECFKPQLAAYSLTAAAAMREAIGTLEKSGCCYVGGTWVRTHLNPLQIQQIIKACEVVLTEEPSIRDSLLEPIKIDILDYLDWLHEAYVVSWQMTKK